MRKWLLVIALVALLGVVDIMSEGFYTDLTDQVYAQGPGSELDLLSEKSVSLEYVNGVVSVLDDALRVGNLPVSTYQRKRSTQVLSDTIYARGYLMFDVSDIPDGSTIDQAWLMLNVERFEYTYPTPPTSGATLDCGLYTVTESWSPSTHWSWEENPSVLTTTEAYTSIAFGHIGVYTIGVKSLVQDWVDGAPNYGVLVSTYPDVNQLTDFSAIISYTMEASNASQPQLRVVYREPPTRTVYLPLVLSDKRPDLIITDIKTVPLQVFITNQGGSAARNFWVDVGLDPVSTPVVNQAWHEWGSDYGVAWQVPALSQGETVSLTVGNAWYVEEYSRWPPNGAKVDDVWGYVDSWGPPNPWGAVKERIEDNNLHGPVHFTEEKSRVRSIH